MANKEVPADFSFLCRVLSPWTTSGEAGLLREDVESGRVDWKAVASYANRTNLAPALHWGLLDKGLWANVPEKLRGFLSAVHRFNDERNESLRLELIHAVGLLNDAGITPLALKGATAFALNIHPDPAARFMLDLDILIREDQMPDAVAALESASYYDPDIDNPVLLSDLNLDEDRHYPGLIRPDGPALIELHGRLLPGRFNAVLETGAVWRESSRAESGRLSGVALALMSPTHQVIHCFAHSELAHSNHRYWRLDLRQMHNFACLCHRFREEVDWDRLAALMELGHAGQALAAYLYIAEQLFRVETPLSSGSSAYARRHLSRVFDERPEWLRIFKGIFECLFRSVDGEHIESLDLAHSVNEGRRRHLRELLWKYSRLERWKATGREFQKSRAIF